MKAIPKIPDSEFCRVRYMVDKAKPVVEYRTIERRQIGTWLFGILPVYEYFYSDWKKNE